ncbi:hypothetical protein [Demequina sp. NBRC 110055]|uniref:hypothetical protein n=1 Tax=Demequina sp. NBRC 110055 TaxID=1570344 RepID=UPI0009FFD59E|nr:hypothetical protein [Demequina sp. NBRC 110055]
MTSPAYLDRNAGLPDMGASGRGPRRMGAADVDAVMACEDAEALAEMKAYARSYFAMSGLIVMATGGAVAASLTGRARWVGASTAVAVLAGLGVIEARRSARQWEAVVDARLATLPA